MKFLLDTNHWSQLQRRHRSILARLQGLPPDTTLYMPVVSQAELLAGIQILKEGRRKRELKDLYEKTVLAAAEILPIDSQVAVHFASILVQLRRIGRPIGTNDMWIAAIALAHDLTVVSNDAHFGHVENLRVEDWTLGS
jgi:predicted nucleic acid-binding protein